MIHISFWKRLLVFFGAPLFVVARKGQGFYVTFFIDRNRLHKKDRVFSVISQKWNFKFLFRGVVPGWKMPTP
jgi:hypothetical protein